MATCCSSRFSCEQSLCRLATQPLYAGDTDLLGVSLNRTHLQDRSESVRGVECVHMPQVALKGSDRWLKAFVKGFMVESASGLAVLEPLDAILDYAGVHGKLRWR